MSLRASGLARLASIAKIGVAVAKIWRKEVIGTSLKFLESG
jgi:hypothetical protein